MRVRTGRGFLPWPNEQWIRCPVSRGRDNADGQRPIHVADTSPERRTALARFSSPPADHAEVGEHGEKLRLAVEGAEIALASCPLACVRMPRQVQHQVAAALLTATMCLSSRPSNSIRAVVCLAGGEGHSMSTNGWQQSHPGQRSSDSGRGCCAFHVMQIGAPCQLRPR